MRRALRRIDELVDREYGNVSLRSNYVAECVHEAVQEAREANKRAAKAGTQAIRSVERGLDEKTSAFLAWARQFGIDVQDAGEARMLIRLGEIEATTWAQRRIREWYELWTAAKQNEQRFREAQIHYQYKGRTNRLDAWR